MYKNVKNTSAVFLTELVILYTQCWDREMNQDMERETYHEMDREMDHDMDCHMVCQMDYTADITHCL